MFVARKPKARKLNKKNREFLLSPDTLMMWAGMTMKDRIMIFQQKFPEKKISESALRRLYLRHGVRRKEIKAEK